MFNFNYYIHMVGFILDTTDLDEDLGFTSSATQVAQDHDMICDTTLVIEDLLLYSCGYDAPCEHVLPCSPYYLMYMYLVKEIVFHIIEHGILSNDFATMTSIFLYQVLLYNLDYESFEIKYCNVFQPSLPSDLTH